MFTSAPRRAKRWCLRLLSVAAGVGMAVVMAAALAATGQAQGAAAPVAAGPPPPAAVGPSVWELHNKGGYVMWVLDACSVLALTIIFERLYSLRRSRVIPPGFLPGLRAVYRDPVADRGRAVEYCRANDSPAGRMVAAFVKRMPRGFAAAEKALEDAGGNEVLRLRANLRVFYAIGSVATLLGLIGTIAGMIRAFMATAEAGDAANKVQLLSTGIYEAMVCTFGGLAVAILVTAFYYYFVGRVEKLVTEINDELTAFADEYGMIPDSDEDLVAAVMMPRL